MTWVLDTCVLLDLVCNDKMFADVMIGAYALLKGGLITRNEDDFRSLYPTLNIFNPATGHPRMPTH